MITALTLLTSVVSKWGWRSMRASWVGIPPMPLSRWRSISARAVVGPPVIHQVRRTAAAQDPGQLGHRAEVGEGGPRHRGPAPAPDIADVDVGDGLQLTAGEHRALRQAGGPGREHDGDGAVGVLGKLGRFGAGDAGPRPAGPRPARPARPRRRRRLGARARGSPGRATGSALASTADRSSRVRRALMPAVIAPSRAAARYATRYSGVGGSTSASTSPSVRPRSARPTATSPASRSRSA